MRSKCRPRLLVAPQGFRAQYVYAANECRYFFSYTQKLTIGSPLLGFSKCGFVDLMSRHSNRYKHSYLVRSRCPGKSIYVCNTRENISAHTHKKLTIGSLLFVFQKLLALNWRANKHADLKILIRCVRGACVMKFRNYTSQQLTLKYCTVFSEMTRFLWRSSSRDIYKTQ